MSGFYRDLSIAARLGAPLLAVVLVAFAVFGWVISREAYQNSIERKIQTSVSRAKKKRRTAR
ncbi:MAG: hypothetical protein QF570_17055 [Myxococcota bacterium]|jgi:hypothetical protein|nr:hypothetical protein [Myxococcota bacterium]